MTIAFHANEGKPGAAEAARRLAVRAAALGLRVAEGPAAAGADAIAVLGGDGTFLRAVRAFPGVPVLGLNLGGLGYLASVGPDGCEDALRALASGRFTVSERRLIEADGRFAALNDIVVTRELTGRAVRLDLEADGRPVTRYLADGLIFATPTGSTAYSLAAGGPVLMPDSAAFVVTPLNPHALGVRPLVVPDGVRFAATARARADGERVRVGVYADGVNVRTLGAGETVAVARAARSARIVEIEGYDPYDVLARKLGWSGSNVT